MNIKQLREILAPHTDEVEVLIEDGYGSTARIDRLCTEEREEKETLILKIYGWEG